MIDLGEDKWQIGKLTYKYALDKQWLLIFQHNTSYGIFSKTTAEFNLQKGKFSYLSRISDPLYVKRFNESYEFLLEYPVEFPNQYNHWIQSCDPLSEWDRDQTGFTAPNYEPVNVSWSIGFGGLLRNHYGMSLLDGKTGSWNWNYAIGDWSIQYILSNGKTPGPHGELVSSVYLWIRIKFPMCEIYTQVTRSSLNYILFSYCFITLK